LSAITVSDDITISLYGPGRLICGLTDASGAIGMAVDIRVDGKDESGNDISYLFEFDSTWSDPGPPPKETINTAGYLVSDKIFYAVTQVTVEKAMSAGINSAIMLWSAQNPVDTYDKLKDACHIARVYWNGYGMSKVRDKRIISTTVRDFLLDPIGNNTLSFMANALAGGNQTVIVEDFFTPRYSEMIPNTDNGGLNNTLPSNNLTKLRPGVDGVYRTRAVAVSAGSGNIWRVVLFPVQCRKNAFTYYTKSTPPTFYYYKAGGPWQSLLMVAVPGMFNTFEVDTSTATAPIMVKVEVTASDYVGMLIFG
jgi:hypothetical protein